MIKGIIVSYNPNARTAVVSIAGQGEITATNILGVGSVASTASVNVFLQPNEQDTVMPADNFSGGNSVAVVYQGSWLLLGRVIANVIAEPTIAGRPGPGAIDVSVTSATDSNGNLKISELGERAQLASVNITRTGGGAFTAKIYNSSNTLQASWGDGSVTLTSNLVDDAGFPFRSNDRAAYLKLLPAGTYTVVLTGERFA